MHQNALGRLCPPGPAEAIIALPSAQAPSWIKGEGQGREGEGGKELEGKRRGWNHEPPIVKFYVRY